MPDGPGRSLADAKENAGEGARRPWILGAMAVGGCVPGPVTGILSLPRAPRRPRPPPSDSYPEPLLTEMLGMVAASASACARSRRTTLVYARVLEAIMRTWFVSVFGTGVLGMLGDVVVEAASAVRNPSATLV